MNYFIIMNKDNLNFDGIYFYLFFKNKSAKLTKFDSLKMLRINLAQLMRKENKHVAYLIFECEKNGK